MKTAYTVMVDLIHGTDFTIQRDTSAEIDALIAKWREDEHVVEEKRDGSRHTHPIETVKKFVVKEIQVPETDKEKKAMAPPPNPLGKNG